MKRFLRTVGQLSLGLVLTQSAVLAVVVVGWVYAWMQRVTVRAWWSRGVQAANGASFELYAGADETTAHLVEWPRWFAGFRGLWAHVKRGIAAVMATWVLTVPAGLLWVFAWYAGWDNSFNKGYEQFWVGPTLGWLGILAFIVAMFYVPLAQARQAVTGSWRSFFDFRLMRRIVVSNGWAAVLLAAAYALAGALLMVLRIAPAFFAQNNPDVAALTEQQVRGTLTLYYLVGGALFFYPSYLALRWLAARAYASSVVRALRSGRIELADLHPFERDQLQRMGVDVAVRAPRTQSLRRVRAYALVPAVVGVVFVAWFAFVAQIFVIEFFNYHEVVGWLNQPLVQVPWIRVMP